MWSCRFFLANYRVSGYKSVEKSTQWSMNGKIEIHNIKCLSLGRVKPAPSKCKHDAFGILRGDINLFEKSCKANRRSCAFTALMYRMFGLQAFRNCLICEICTCIPLKIQHTQFIISLYSARLRNDYNLEKFRKR